MMIGFGIDFCAAADIQAFVERVAVVLEKQADECGEPLRAAGIRDAVATMRKAAETAGMVDHGAGLGAPVMSFDAVERNGREIVPAMTFADGERIA